MLTRCAACHDVQQAPGMGALWLTTGTTLVHDSLNSPQEPEYLEAKAIPWNMEYDNKLGEHSPACTDMRAAAGQF